MIDRALFMEQARPPPIRMTTLPAGRPVAPNPIAQQIGWLQSTAGNAAVVQLLGGGHARSPQPVPTIQRCGDVAPEDCGCHGNGEGEATQELPAIQRTVQRDGPTVGDVPLIPPRESAGADIPGVPGARLGAGTKASPKLRKPAQGQTCPGACGAGCASTCKPQAEYTRAYIDGDTKYVVKFPNPLLCRTHQGCQDHDACFNKCVAEGEESMVGACHNRCSAEAVGRWGLHNTMQWMFGHGPAEDWWWFVDQPVVVEATPIASPSQHAAIDNLALPSLADAIVRRAATEYELAGPWEEARWRTFHQRVKRDPSSLPDSHEVARELFAKMLAAESRNDGGGGGRDYVTINLSPRDSEPAWKLFPTCDWLAAPFAELVSSVAMTLPQGGAGINRVNVVFGKPGRCGGPLVVPVTGVTDLR